MSHDVTDSETETLSPSERLNRKTPEVKGDNENDFVKKLRTIKDQLHIQEDARVIYPGSSTHAGVARVFGKGFVTHVDPLTDVCKVLTDGGYHAVALPIEEYRPAHKADLIVFNNSYGDYSDELIDGLLKDEGLVIANNWGGHANELNSRGTWQLLGSVDPVRDGEEPQWDDSAISERKLGTLHLGVTPGGKMYLGDVRDGAVHWHEMKIVDSNIEGGEEVEVNEPISSTLQPMSTETLFVFSRK